MAISQNSSQTPSTSQPLPDSVSDKTGRTLNSNASGVPLKPSTDTVADKTGR